MSSSPSFPGQHERLGLKYLLHEPLLHFLIAGGILFVAYARLNHGPADPLVDSGCEVHVTAQQVEWLKETWTRQWQRPPNDRELRQLVNDYLREELLAREALALGLGNDDTIVRRRLAQKMELLVQDTARVAERTDEELRRFFDVNRDQFQTPTRVSFTHRGRSFGQHGFFPGSTCSPGRPALVRADRAGKGGSGRARDHSRFSPRELPKGIDLFPRWSGSPVSVA